MASATWREQAVGDSAEGWVASSLSMGAVDVGECCGSEVVGDDGRPIHSPFRR